MFKLQEIQQEYSQDEGIDHVEELNEIEYYRRIPVEKDIQAIITVLGRRNTDFEEKKGEAKQKKYLDLSNTDLFQADFSSAIEELNKKQNFDYFNFSSSILVESDCSNSSFKHANCIYTHFEDAQCVGARFENAVCARARFENAVCTRTRFENAACTGAHFENACCAGVHFENADCIGANFKNADCIGANFENAACFLANFENAKRITTEQLSKAKSLEDATGLSDEMKEEIVRLNPKLEKDLFPKRVKKAGDEQEPQGEGGA